VALIRQPLPKPTDRRRFDGHHHRPPFLAPLPCQRRVCGNVAARRQRHHLKKGIDKASDFLRQEDRGACQADLRFPTPSPRLGTISAGNDEEVGRMDRRLRWTKVGKEGGDLPGRRQKSMTTELEVTEGPCASTKGYNLALLATDTSGWKPSSRSPTPAHRQEDRSGLQESSCLCSKQIARHRAKPLADHRRRHREGSPFATWW